jgi:hypothetical protein
MSDTRTKELGQTNNRQLSSSWALPFRRTSFVLASWNLLYIRSVTLTRIERSPVTISLSWGSVSRSPVKKKKKTVKATLYLYFGYIGKICDHKCHVLILFWTVKYPSNKVNVSYMCQARPITCTAPVYALVKVVTPGILITIHITDISRPLITYYDIKKIDSNSSIIGYIGYPHYRFRSLHISIPVLGRLTCAQLKLLCELC